jgi:hypothetical protein
MKTTDWGVIQKLEVEADTRNALLGALSIATVEYNKITHYQELTFDNPPEATKDNQREVERFYGANSLTLYPYYSGSDRSINKLPYELEGAEEITNFVESWLKKNAKYPEHIPDTDGSINNGFRVDMNKYGTIRIVPVYIIYGK